MDNKQWLKTSCALCAQNCGLEVVVEDNRITKVRPDKDNPRSEGYVCRKGMNIAFHQHHTDRNSEVFNQSVNGFIGAMPIVARQAEVHTGRQGLAFQCRQLGQHGVGHGHSIGASAFADSDGDGVERSG